jgi:hypothetical protein
MLLAARGPLRVAQHQTGGRRLHQSGLGLRLGEKRQSAIVHHHAEAEVRPGAHSGGGHRPTPAFHPGRKHGPVSFPASRPAREIEALEAGIAGKCGPDMGGFRQQGRVAARDGGPPLNRDFNDLGDLSGIATGPEDSIAGLDFAHQQGRRHAGHKQLATLVRHAHGRPFRKDLVQAPARRCGDRSGLDEQGDDCDKTRNEMDQRRLRRGHGGCSSCRSAA